MNAPTAAQRSATQGPSYNNRAASRNGAKSISTIVTPRAARIFSAALNASSARPSRKKIRLPVSGTATRSAGGSAPTAPSGRSREYGSASGPAIAASAANASSVVRANNDTQSRLRQAGTTPAVDTRPRLGLSPTMLLSPAGTRPDPAVSVPSASGTRPAATAIAEPVLDPPGISAGSNRLRAMP